jgi:hypothetical protein
MLAFKEILKASIDGLLHFPDYFTCISSLEYFIYILLLCVHYACS